MITVKLMGGLGNQMFQYAYGLALKERGYEVQYDRSKLIEGTIREYSLGHFGIEAVNNGGPHEGAQSEIYEGNLNYKASYLEPYDPSTLIGYWQTEKYFSDIAAKVRKAFTTQFTGVTMSKYIAVHVRRQDYLGLQNFHGMPTMDYYNEAIEYIRRNGNAAHKVIIFSDDPEWCKENFPKSYLVSDGTSKIADLSLMSACAYQVIANSSFSWWGAWLGPQKIVVAPKVWFADPNIDYSDIVPERWVKL
jgi:hypothetical protein